MSLMSDVEWFKNAIIYHILIDRFAGFKSTNNWDKPIFLGGNINAIIEKFPYIENLGVNTIWISPFYKTNAYHGYHITDFYKVEPHFGTIQDIKKLTEVVHKHDMKIIADFVPNHCSKQHPFFQQAQKKKNSQYNHWFYFTKWPNDYICFLSINDLPKLNLNFPEAREHIINAAKYWLSCGFDGFRLDHVIGPTQDFWEDFKKQIKKDYPHVVLIGEAWMCGVKFKELRTINIKHKFLKWLFGASSDYLLNKYIGVFDGVLDFRFQELIKEYINNIYNEHLRDAADKKIKNHFKKYPKDYFLTTFLDNHDMNRFLFQCHNDKEKLKQAATLQFAINQPAIIYYGTEIGILQYKSIWNFPSHGDLQARQPMNWSDRDNDLLSFYKKLIELKKRKKEKSLGIID